MRPLVPLSLWITISSALPQIALPFNSQVPPVARVGHDYEFQLSATTFESPRTISQYVLKSAPAWLSLDSSPRTLSGKPALNDVGSSNFKITALDNDGSTDMPVTLVVVESQAPKGPQDISEYLAKAGSLAGPSNLAIGANCAFHIDFPLELFVDSTGQKLFYYATLADHTPLPAWLLFDSDILGFSGTTPDQTSSAQSYEVELIASDVAGFAGAWTNFTLLIDSQRLSFNMSEQDISIANGVPLQYTALLSQLTLDGVTVQQSQIANATAQKPNWVTFDPKNLYLSGNPPEENVQEDIIVTVVDNVGDEASIILHLRGGDTSVNSTFFSKQQRDINAAIGAPADYDIEPSIFAQSGLKVSVDLGSTADWLRFNETDLSINGKIPATVQPLVATATITARSPTIGSFATETFHITVVSTTLPQVPTSTTLVSRLPPPASTTSTNAGKIAASSSPEASKMPFGAIIAVSTAAVLIAVLVMLWFCQRLRRRQRHSSPTETSRPALGEAPLLSIHDSKHEQDIEKNGSSKDVDRSTTPDNPPQVALNLPRSQTSNRLDNRTSQSSYLNEGEGTILSYHDRSSWDHAASEGHVPHHSMSLPTEIARQSRGSIQISPRWRAHLRSSQLSQLDLEEFHTRRLSGIGHGRHDSQASESRQESGTPFDSIGSSGRDMIESFPSPAGEARNPKRSSSKYSRATQDARRISTFLGRRSKSIRMVERSPTNGTGRSSVLQTFNEEVERPLEVRRQSYIRRRAASRSPFFSTVAVGSSRGSRAPSQASSRSVHSDALHSSFEPSSSFLSRGSGSILDYAIDNLRRQRTQKSKVTAGGSESNSLEHPREARLSGRMSGLPFHAQSMTANSSRQFESASSFCSTESSIRESDFNLVTDLSPLEATRRDQESTQPGLRPYPKKMKRSHSGKRSAWAAKLGRDYNGEIGQATSLSNFRDDPKETATPSTSDRMSLTSSGRISQLRRSRLAAETRAWGRRLPLSLLLDANASHGPDSTLEGFHKQTEQEENQDSNDVRGKEVIGLGLTTNDDWETIDQRPSGSSQRLERDETPVFL